MIIAPSILSADFANLEQDVKKVSKAKYLHIDVMDGHFVPNISIGIPVVKSLRKVSSQVFDVHLMISNPLKYSEQFIKAGADIITFHVESDDEPKEVIDLIKKHNTKVGISIKPNTSVEAIMPYIKDVDMVLVMSVEPGFGGQKLIESTLDKVEQLYNYKKENSLNYDIQVDGGINVNNVKTVVNKGANVIVAGSAIFNDNTEKSLDEFINVIKK